MDDITERAIAEGKAEIVKTLIARIKRARRSNMSDGIIRAGLVAEGWAKDDVIEAMEASK